MDESTKKLPKTLEQDLSGNLLIQTIFQKALGHMAFRSNDWVETRKNGKI
jgi:hypothetical protein